jgi:transposase InsO family protein
MPWKNVLPMDEKLRFISLYKTARFGMAELCREFGISRKTGHKWLERFETDGAKGLEERSRAPKSCSHRTSDEIARLICSEKRKHKTWGPKKIQELLIVKHGIDSPPAVSTVGEVLKRNGMVTERRRRGAVFKVERGTMTAPERPNHVLGVDFKGWFMMGDCKRCDPLTVTDLHSRLVMKIAVMEETRTAWVQAEFRALFRCYGLPEAIRVDNGAPFASNGPGGLSRLSVWWIGLGIEVQFSRPGCPQDNGCHERMHRTLKDECCKSPSANRYAQQQRFDRWRKEFNEERPHEALGMRFPSDVYQASDRRLDERIKPNLYVLGTETKRVNAGGYIGVDGKACYVGESFAGVDVALERKPESDLILVKYSNVTLGQLDGTPNQRLRPTASDAGWETKPC